MLGRGREEAVRRRVEALRAEFQRQQGRRVISRDLVLREYVGGKVLFDEASTEDLLASGDVKLHDVLRFIDEINTILKNRYVMELSGVTAALARNPREHTSLIVLVYIEP